MKDEKELSIIVNDKQEIKLYEESTSIKIPSVIELSIARCPLSCENCKIIYSHKSKSTGIRIICRCHCHIMAKEGIV